MKIFNIIITTEAKQKDSIKAAYANGWDRGKKFTGVSDAACVNEIIHSLKELRRNTWDVERVDQAIEWLQDNFFNKK